MKKHVKIIIGIALVLIIEVTAGIFVYRYFSSRGMTHNLRGARYSIQMNRHGMGRGIYPYSNSEGRRGINPGSDSGQGFGMRPGMVPGQGFGMRPGMVPGQGSAIRRGFGQQRIDSLARRR
jgi:hypothetical protein